MCECIERVNKDILAEHNTVLLEPFWTSSGKRGLFIETTKLDSSKRGKPKKIFTTYCPFCGEKHD
jgi:hypothetical protein